MEYKLVAGDWMSHHDDSLEENVNKAIEEGWVPQGGAFLLYSGTGLVCQAMVRVCNRESSK